MIKDYGFLLRNEPAYAAKAARVSALAKDVTEFLGQLDQPEPINPQGTTVAYHSACSLQHGQQIDALPSQLLTQAGFDVRHIPERHLSCGSAGTYNILEPEIAVRLRDRKVANIVLTAPDVIATGNIGCIAQIASGTSIPVLHTIELLDFAHGGPKLDGLESAKGSREIGRLLPLLCPIGNKFERLLDPSAPPRMLVTASAGRAANDWVPSRPMWEARIAAARFLTCSSAEAAARCGDRHDALADWRADWRGRRASCASFVKQPYSK